MANTGMTTHAPSFFRMAMWVDRSLRSKVLGDLSQQVSMLGSLGAGVLSYDQRCDKGRQASRSENLARG